MSATSDSEGTAEARAILEKMPGIYFEVLKRAVLEQLEGGRIQCSFDLPGFGMRVSAADTASEAVRALLVELTDTLTSTPIDKWPNSWRELEVPTPSERASSDRGRKSMERFQAKARQVTIGVTMPVSLKESLYRIAEETNTSFADVARGLAAVGFDDFDERCFEESAESVFRSFFSEVEKWQPSANEQVMLRLDPHLAIRLRASAKEYSRSASEMSAMCLAHGLALQEQFAVVEEKVEKCRGPATRRLAPSLGLGESVELLSGVLAGSIVAPLKLLRRLADAINVHESTLRWYLKRSFDSRTIPAFKVGLGKPQLSNSAKSWQESVKSLKLPVDKTNELLALEE